MHEHRLTVFCSGGRTGGSNDGCLASCAAHFAFKLDQSVKSLVVSSVCDMRNLVILLGHWALHAYGIIAVTELKDLSLHLPIIGLVPLPAVFYILTARFTDPTRINMLQYDMT